MRLKSRLGRAKPKYSGRIVIELEDKNGGVFRVDLPVELRKDSQGVYPMVAIHESEFDEPVTFDRIVVTQRHSAHA